jgi:hypothetical protein
VITRLCNTTLRMIACLPKLHLNKSKSFFGEVDGKTTSKKFSAVAIFSRLFL